MYELTGSEADELYQIVDSDKPVKSTKTCK